MSAWLPMLLIIIGWTMVTEAAFLPHADEFSKMLAVRLSDMGIGVTGGGLTMLIPRANPSGPPAVTAKQVVAARSREDLP